MKGEYKEFIAGEELKEFDLVTIRDGKVYKWRKKKIHNIYSDFDFVVGGFVLIIGCVVIYFGQPVIKLFLGIPLILVSLLAFYLGYLCLD